jgi:uncharacterized membrane-anchored protein
MFKSVSKTQTANYVAMFMFIVQLFNWNITQSETETVVNAVVGLIAVGYTFYLRYKQGDLRILGGRK